MTINLENDIKSKKKICCLFSVESLKPGKVTVETHRPVTMATDTVEAVVCDVNDIKSGESVLIFITIYYTILMLYY